MPIHPDSDRHGRSGQAMIELIAGLVVLLVLLVGIVELTNLTQAQSNTLITAREQAGISAFDSLSISAFPEHIADVQAGNDGKSYSVDDETTPGNSAAFQRVVVDRTGRTPSDWDTLDALPLSPLSILRSSTDPVIEFGLVEGTAEASVDLLPGVRHLLYDAERIDIRSRVWMTRTEGIY